MTIGEIEHTLLNEFLTYPISSETFEQMRKRLTDLSEGAAVDIDESAAQDGLVKVVSR